MLLHLRGVYVLLLAAGVLLAAGGLGREATLTLLALLALATAVESLLQILDFVPVLLLVGTTAVGTSVYHAYPDLPTKAYAVLCVVTSLALYIRWRVLR